MSIPLVQSYRIARYILEQKLKGNKKYPLVLMLEPLFQCNLACAGCGKIDYPNEILRKRVSVEDALRAVDECGAPVVSIPGGEPLIHKEMPEIVRGIVQRKKFVYLCTNALLLEHALHAGLVECVHALVALAIWRVAAALHRRFHSRAMLLGRASRAILAAFTTNARQSRGRFLSGRRPVRDRYLYQDVAQLFGLIESKGDRALGMFIENANDLIADRTDR
jgi:hypothetical protein